MVQRKTASALEPATDPTPDSNNVQVLGSQYPGPLITPPPPGVSEVERLMEWPPAPIPDKVPNSEQR